jgi:phosphoribosylformimino-5-aminoimidazole carboxamide ribotide isomerase
MIAVPAVDIRGGRCVQLVGGRPEEERVSLPDPVGVAHGWTFVGFSALHVVDLDGALGVGSNLPVIERIAAEVDCDLQVGGGLRTDEAVDAVFSAGADRAIVGTRAVEDPSWLSALSRRHPDKVVVAADVRDGRVLSRGWVESTGRPIVDFLAAIEGLPLAGILCTDVGREGKVQGIDRSFVEEVLAASVFPVWISGGVTTVEELRFLDDRGAAGAVLGMALYTGVLDANLVAKEFGA